MAKAHELVRGLGMGSNFLDRLIKEIEKQGGNPAVIPFLTKPRFDDNLALVAKTIVNLDFRIPASEVRDRTEKWYRRNFEVEAEFLETFRNLFWYGVLGDLDIPYLHYSNDEGDEVPAVPSWHKKKLAGRKMEFPLFLDEEYVVVDIDFGEGEIPNLGELIFVENLEILCIAKRSYFNFEK